MASNDSVSEHRFVSPLSPDDIAVIIIIIIIIIIYLHTRMHKAVSFYNNFLQDRVINSQPRVIPQPVAQPVGPGDHTSSSSTL